MCVIYQNLEREVAELEAAGIRAKGEAGDGKPEGEIEELAVFVAGLAKEVDAEMLQKFFGSCGVIDRITILLDFKKESKG